MAAERDLDAQLMLRVKRDDLEAFEELVEKYKQPVIGMIYRTLPDVQEAEDLAQNVFVQVYKSAHRYRVSAKFSTWLFTIARNLCLNEIRRRARHPTVPLDGSNREEAEERPRQVGGRPDTGPVETVLRGELERKVDEAVRDLPENQRTAILLYQREELSYEEIARVLGCSLSATKSLIHRGREGLRVRLKAYLRSGDWETRSSGAKAD